MMRVREVMETCLYVSDLVEAERFYRDVLGLEFVCRREGRHVFFRCGNRMLLIFDPVVCRENGADLPPHGASGPGHVAFAVAERELDAWRIHLAAEGVEIEKTIDWPQGGQSFYFRDPDGNSLEVTTPRIWGIGESATLGDA